MTESQILALLLTGTENQLNTVREYLLDKHITDLQRTDQEEIQFLTGLESFDFDPPSFADFKLSRRPQRTAELTDLILNMSELRNQWLQYVRQTHWSDIDCGPTIHRLRTESHLAGIGRAATFAVLKASMQLQKFPAPKNLHKILWNHDHPAP